MYIQYSETHCVDGAGWLGGVITGKTSQQSQYLHSNNEGHQQLPRKHTALCGNFVPHVHMYIQCTVCHIVYVIFWWPGLYRVTLILLCASDLCLHGRLE